MVGKVVAHEGIQQVLVLIAMGDGHGDELAVTGRCGVRCGAAQELVGSSVSRAAATKSAGFVPVFARSRISVVAFLLPPIMR